MGARGRPAKAPGAPPGLTAVLGSSSGKAVSSRPTTLTELCSQASGSASLLAEFLAGPGAASSCPCLVWPAGAGRRSGRG